MKYSTLRPLSLLLCLLLTLTFCTACGSGAASDTVSSVTASSASASAAEVYDYDYGYYYAEPSYTEEWADEAEIEDKTYDGNSVSGSYGGTGSLALADTKLIYTASIDMESTAFDEAASGLYDLVCSLGGYFQSSDVNNYGTYRYASYTIRIPSESFDSFCNTVGTICQVDDISRSAEDVSEYYYDTESRLATQKTKLERLQALLAEAEDMEDIITLESAISETELEIEDLSGTLRHYDSLVSYSTVYLYLSEVYQYTEIEEPAIGFGEKLASAFRRGCTSFVTGMQELLLAFARSWVVWLIWIAVIVCAVLLIRRAVRRGRAKAEARAQQARAQRESRAAPSAPYVPARGSIPGSDTDTDGSAPQT